MIGQTLKHYRIESKLGEGGMGVVYTARDTHLDRLVAIKVLASEAVADPKRKLRFVREAKAASALNHPNIVTIYDIDQEDGVDFIVMELVPGKTLDQFVATGSLSVNAVLRCAVQIADALAQAHAAGIVHRDLKPANIIVTKDGLVKVLDFGLAKLAANEDIDDRAVTQSDRAAGVPLTEEGGIIGTAAYVSPEQAEGKRTDARSDIFSFGAVLYEMITGRRAFQGETRMSTLSAILRAEPAPIGDTVKGLPPQLEWLIAQCLRKDRRRRFQHMEDVKVGLEALRYESEGGRLAPATPVSATTRRPRFIWIVAGVTAALMGGAVWWMSRPEAPARRPILTRLTSDSGLSTDPALSPDGRLLAYASDRSGEGHLDIWIRQVAGGEPIRLTADIADDSEPSFSPDGAQLVFRSEGEGGGIYVISALGGEPRLLARRGRRPRYSPDGRWIAYWVGEQHLGGEIYIVGSTGGSPAKLETDPPLRARFPLWFPDGKHLVFLAQALPFRSRPALPEQESPSAPGESRLGASASPAPPSDWWVASIQTGKAFASGAFEVFRKQNLAVSGYSAPADWLSGEILFSVRGGDSTSLWKAPISLRRRRVTEPAQQLTFGTSLDVNPSGSHSGALVFASESENMDVWSLAVDANKGKALSEPLRVTQDAALDMHPSISADGQKIVFRSTRAGNPDVWMKDLESGRENPLTADREDQQNPIFSADGLRVAYTSAREAGSVLRVMAWGPRGYSPAAELPCADCGRLSDITRDGTQTLHSGRRGLVLIDVVSRKETELLSLEHLNPTDPRLSPDERWVAFHAIPVGNDGDDTSRRQIFVAPVRPESPAREREWIPVTDGSAMDRFPCWSPDSNLIYFISERDGFRCIAAQRLNARTKLPDGDMFYIHHFHSARRSMMNFENPNWARLSVSRDRIVFTLSERTGNIWMTQMPALGR